MRRKIADGVGSIDRGNAAAAQRRGSRSWTVLVIGTVLAACASLSVHVYMLEDLHVPYPYDFPLRGPATWPAWPLLIFAGLQVHRSLSQTHPAWSLSIRALIVFLLFAGLKEKLVRSWFMSTINSNPPSIYPLLRDGVPNWILLACASFGCALAASRSRPRSASPSRVIVDCCAVSCLVIAASILLDGTWGRLLAQLSFLDMPSKWNPPYDWHILLPAYVTAIEPAIAGTALALLVWEALPPRRGQRIGCLVLLIALIKGHIVEPSLNVLYAHSTATMAILSVGQFTLEGLALAMIVAATVQIAHLNE